MVLDIKISRENNNFATSVYWNPTFSGVFTNFESFFFKSYELSLLHTLLYRGFSPCSNMGKFITKLVLWKSVFKSNGYYKNFID